MQSRRSDPAKEFEGGGMMENIKYRAWDCIEQRMYSNVQNGIYQDPDEIIDFGRILELERFKVMQYIGLNDKNSREIYEEDLYKNEFGIWVWKWKPQYARFVPVQPGNWIASATQSYTKMIEIFGNIYENSELIGALK